MVRVNSLELEDVLSLIDEDESGFYLNLLGKEHVLRVAQPQVDEASHVDQLG